MGVDFTAKLVYGVNFGRSNPFDGMVEEDPDEGYLDRDTLDEWIVKQFVAIPEGEYYWQHDDKCPLEMVYVGYEGDPDLVLGIRESYQSASWKDGPTSVDVPPVNDEWDRTLLDFCKKHDITLEGRPGWFLGVYQW